jgi:hypothetical protein
MLGNLWGKLKRKIRIANRRRGHEAGGMGIRKQKKQGRVGIVLSSPMSSPLLILNSSD